MASCLAEPAARPPEAAARAPVFASVVGTPLSYNNVYHRVLQPALAEAGLDGEGIAFHAFRKACGSLLSHHGKTLKQVQGWLRHSQLTTTMNVYIQQVDDSLGGADAWDLGEEQHGAVIETTTSTARSSTGRRDTTPARGSARDSARGQPSGSPTATCLGAGGPKGGPRDTFRRSGHSPYSTNPA